LFANPSPFILSNPIPFFPFPLTRGRGFSYIREASPLFDSPLIRGEGRIFLKGAPPLSIPFFKHPPPLGVFKRGFTPLYLFLPLSSQERGIKGVR
jgi:hypothetical protein